MQSSKKFINRLIDESSPYLLQHAHNPVEWLAWSAEAFEKAEAEDKPVFVSLGYSACHWCHVMERESFEDEETAKMMNEHFVNIKVDMEERADVDQIYMTFVQMTTGRGGYPLNVFLTPDKKPFFGGTYFPPERRFRMPSFQQILTSVADAWKNKRAELLHSASDILIEMQRIGLAEYAPGELSIELLDAAFENLSENFDQINGGFGGAPKFPAPMSLEFLLRYYKRTGNKNALEMVLQTCTKMANGGIYDQIGGGFHRYATDAIWRVPHFEKMLYDNAQLAKLYLHVFQITKEDFYKRIAVETLEYIRREMLDAQGGFYSTQDADAEGVEGKFFVWTSEEIKRILGEEDARIFNFYYDVSSKGNFEEKNILNIKNSISETAESLKITEEEIIKVLRNGKAKLLNEREKRIKPFCDEKILTAWNGLMLATFAEASAILDSNDYLEIAEKNADFILENMQTDGFLLRTYKDGKAKINAYLEDYANFIDGLIELFQVSGEVKYLREAKRIADLMIDAFWDEKAGGFYFTAKDHEEMILRPKDFTDHAMPSGNAAAADALLKLTKFSGDAKHEKFAVIVLKLIASQIRRYAGAFGKTLATLEFYFGKTKEIVIIGEKGNELEKAVWKNYMPDKIVVLAENTSEDSQLIHLLENRKKIQGKPTAYVCENSICQKPLTDIDELTTQLI